MNKVRRAVKKFSSKPKYDAMKKRWAEERARKQEMGDSYTGAEFSTGNEWTDRDLIKAKPMNAWQLFSHSTDPDTEITSRQF